MEIWIFVAGVEFGPYSEKKVREHLAEGLVASSDQARSNPQDEWTTLGDLLERSSATPSQQIQLLPVIEPEPISLPASPANAFPIAETSSVISPLVENAPFLSVPSPGELPSTPPLTEVLPSLENIERSQAVSAVPLTAPSPLPVLSPENSTSPALQTPSPSLPSTGALKATGNAPLFRVPRTSTGQLGKIAKLKPAAVSNSVGMPSVQPASSAPKEESSPRQHMALTQPTEFFRPEILRPKVAMTTPLPASISSSKLPSSLSASPAPSPSPTSPSAATVATASVNSKISNAPSFSSPTKPVRAPTTDSFTQLGASRRRSWLIYGGITLVILVVAILIAVHQIMTSRSSPPPDQKKTLSSSL